MCLFKLKDCLECCDCEPDCCKCACECKCEDCDQLSRIVAFGILILATSGIFIVLPILIKAFEERERLDRFLQFLIFMSFALVIFLLLTSVFIYVGDKPNVFLILSILILYFWIVVVITILVLNYQMKIKQLRNLNELAQTVGITCFIIFIIEAIFFAIGPSSSFYIIFAVLGEFVWELSFFYIFIIHRLKKYDQFAGWWFLAMLVSITFHIMLMVMLILKNNIIAVIFTIISGILHFITIFCIVRLICISQYVEEHKPKNGIKVEMHFKHDNQQQQPYQQNQPYIYQQPQPQPQQYQPQQQYQQPPQQYQYYPQPQQQQQQYYPPPQYQYNQPYNQPPSNPQMHGPIVYNYPQKNA